MAPHNDAPIRAFKDDVLAHFGNPLLDVRSPEECSGECTSMSVYPFTARDELDAIYRGEAVLTEGDNVIAVSLYRCIAVSLYRCIAVSPGVRVTPGSC